MSSNEFILNWLNNDLKIEPNIKDISKEFSNGYKFAEVLHILNELSEKEREIFKNSEKYEEIKSNFNKLQNILHDKLNLDIREEEFKEVMNHNIATATIILYKIKNSMIKKKMNFLNIRTSSNQLTKDEINKKVLELLDYGTSKELNNEYGDEEDLNKTKTKKIRDIKKKYTQKNVEINSIKSDSNEGNTSDRNHLVQNSEKKNIENINIDNSNSNKNFDITLDKKDYNSLANNTNLSDYKKLTMNKTLEAKKEQLTLNTMETLESNPINTISNVNINKTQISKKILKPFSGSFNFKSMKNPKTNVLPKILPKININTTFEFKSSIMNSNVGNLSKYPVFNKRLNALNSYDYNSFNDEKDFNNDYGMTKIKEIKNRIKKQYDDIKRQEKIQKELQLKKEYGVNEKYQLDFVNKIKNPLYKFTKFTGVNLFMHSNSKYNSCNKRLEYSKDLKEKTYKEEINQQILNIRKIMNNNTQNINSRLKFNNLNISENKNNSIPFNKAKYFKKLNNINKEEFSVSIIEKYKKEKECFPLIKKVTYSIIDLMEDIYNYQYDNDKEIIDLEDFKTFSECFIKGKHKEKVVFDNEDLLIKSAEINDDIIIDIDNLKLSDEEKYMIQDYINYIGIWNDEKILDNELRGYKYDLKEIKSDLPQDYEPTENEIDDVTLPVRLNDNYTLGNTLLNIIDTKYSINKDIKDNYESNKENIFVNNNFTQDNNNLSKWNYIPYKLSFVGYPLSGRKYIAENLNKKYPNIKIYSIKKILRDYYIEYKTMTEKIEGNPKYKSLKPNQVTQMKEEREKQLNEFTPILNIIQPYINFIKKEKIRKKLEEEEKKKESENLNSNKHKQSIKSPRKRRKSIVQKEKEEEELVEDNINENLKIIPNDEVLFNLLVYKIEKDFPLKSKEENDKEIIEKQTKIFQILKNIENLEKQKKEATKPNPKDDIAINNLQKELENIKLESIKGFILVDYPCNINQAILLENYLTGYVDEIQKPKSEKNKIINNLSNFLDFKIMPKKNNVFKRAGIDFVINLINPEKTIDERFNSIKYDPSSDKIYTNSDLSEENKNKQPLDKKIIERLVSDVPYLPKENFDFYKDEYNNNIYSIMSLYNKFGMYVDMNTSQENEMQILGIDISEKELKKSFQSIELETNIKKNKVESLVNDSEKIENSQKKKTERGSIKRGSITKPSMTKGNKNDESMESKSVIFDLEEKNKNKIIDFISNNIINWLYKEKDKSDKIVFYSHHPEYNTNEENDRIKFDPDLKVNEINDEKSKKTIKQQLSYTTAAMTEPRLTNLINKNSEHIIKELSSYNQKYNKYLSKFIYLINLQKNTIYKRLNLIQKKFRDFLNQETNKKKVLHIYIKKYNEFFRDKQIFFESEKAKEEFSADIEEVNNNLWILINEKEKDSINELESIKNCGFIEKELEKFYENIKELCLAETERFLIMINSVIYLHSYGNKNINTDKKEDGSSYLFKNNIKRDFNSKINNKNINIFSEIQNKEKILYEIYFDKNYIIKNLPNINFDPKSSTNSFLNIANNIFKNISNKKKESKNEIKINNLIGQITNRMEIIFMNSIKLILEYQDIIDNLIKDIKTTATIPYKKYNKKRTNKFALSSNNSSMMSSTIGGGEKSPNEKIIKMLQNEKNKYKYRMCYIKSFTYKYMAIITQTAQNIYNNLDQWIVTSVSLQNDALNVIIAILKKKLKSHRLINEKKEINTIEMDAFEKIIDDNDEGSKSEIGIKPIDNSSVGIGRIYNKINIDYLINDNFSDIKVEEILNATANEEKNNKSRLYKNDKNDKIENKRYKIILPNELDRSINSSINNSFGIGNKNKLKEFDFYFDLNKFNIIYKNLKKYEIEENIISKDLFYEIFIKQYIIDKYAENMNEKEINMDKKNINPINKNTNSPKLKNNTSNESDEEEDEHINSLNEQLFNNQSNALILNGICNALKMLNTKQYNKIYTLYQISIEHKTQTNKDQKETLNINTKEPIKEEKKENNKDNKDNTNDKNNIDNKDNINNTGNKETLENKENKDNNNENNQKEINNESDNVEYDIYLNTSEIFTILPLIGCKIMNLIEEENILKDLKEKLIRGKYLYEKDFMEYHFWFEQEFEYQNEDIMFQQMMEENKNTNNNKKSTFTLQNENKKINIKEFLFNIWKDEKGDKMDFEKFISVLKINKYITDLNGLNDENYYNIIFNNEN